MVDEVTEDRSDNEGGQELAQSEAVEVPWIGRRFAGGCRHLKVLPIARLRGNDVSSYSTQLFGGATETCTVTIRLSQSPGFPCRLLHDLALVRQMRRIPASTGRVEVGRQHGMRCAAS